jgi:hypothetical protein
VSSTIYLSLSRQVFTPETQRAKELLDLFNALNAPLLSTDQRLDVLLNVKVCLSAYMPICI